MLAARQNVTLAAYPLCGQEIKRLREEDREALFRQDIPTRPDGRNSDCDYQHYVHIGHSLLCPAVPSHYETTDGGTSVTYVTLQAGSKGHRKHYVVRMCRPHCYGSCNLLPHTTCCGYTLLWPHFTMAVH